MAPIDWKASFNVDGPADPDFQPGGGLTSNDVLQLDSKLYDQFDRSRSAAGQEELFKRLNPDEVAPDKLMIGGIVPRPIGFVSSLDEQGVPNLAPFSYFQAAGHRPPMIFLFFSVTSRKDSCNNIKTTKEFTVNMISEPFIEAANYTAIDAPAELSEWSLSGLTQASSTVVKPPRVAESAYSMECVLEHFYDVHEDKDPATVTGTAVLGRVKMFHIRKDLLTARGGIDLDRMRPVSRLGGISYGRTTESYEIPRPKYAEASQDPRFVAALRQEPEKVEDNQSKTLSNL